jgi:hypothetical protein
MTAQNQHYVPKFILRQFLSDETKEQVSVYDKHTDRVFFTSIKNIMAERRFNDFNFDNCRVSFEPIACHIESLILPRYQKITENRRLESSAEEKTELAFLIAFQFSRTKYYRELAIDLEDEIKKKVEALGRRMEDVEGWTPLTEDRLKIEHLTAIRRNLEEFASVIGKKDFFLASSAPGRSFYLGDNPVCLHNGRDFRPYGNLGLAVSGIEIYLPLTSDLMLCAWCPSIIAEVRKGLGELKRKIHHTTIAEVMAGRMSMAQMKQSLDAMAPQCVPMEVMVRAFEEGTPLSSSTDNMDFYNSLQMTFANRYVISKHADFELAKRHTKDFPHLRRGNRPRFG